MKHYIVIAEEGDLVGEKKLIARYLEGAYSNGDWVTPDGIRWQIVVTGVGAVNVIKALSGLDRDAVLINIGYAGSANYPVGSVAQVDKVCLNHPNCSYPEPELYLSPLPDGCLKADCAPVNSLCYSGADFVLQSDYKDCVFDMELAYIAALGFKSLSSLKIVSDNLSLHAYREVAAGVE